MLWTTFVGASGAATSSPAVSADGTVYAAGRMDSRAALYAIDPRGAVVRSLPGTSIRTPDTFEVWTRVASSGAAYAVDSEGGLYGLFKDGSGRYRTVGRRLLGPPAIDGKGRLLVGSERGVWGFDVHAADDTSTVSFRRTSAAQAPVLGPDGTMYALSNRRLYALDSAGSVRWEAPAGVTTPVLDPRGRLYYTDANRLVALAADGTPLWEFAGRDVLSAPALAPDGSVAVVGADGRVHVIRPDGRRRWAFAQETPAWSLPVVGPDGTVYAFDRSGRITAVGPAGKRRWSLKMTTTCGTPAVGEAGRIYFECRDGNVYAVAPP